MDLPDNPDNAPFVVSARTVGVEANINITNMDRADFADAADDGVFRGFSDQL